jgi:hypothetical protein
LQGLYSGTAKLGREEELLLVRLWGTWMLQRLWIVWKEKQADPGAIGALGRILPVAQIKLHRSIPQRHGFIFSASIIPSEGKDRDKKKRIRISQMPFQDLRVFTLNTMELKHCSWT